MGKSMKLFLLTVLLLMAVIAPNMSGATASAPPNNWGCKTTYPVRVQQSSTFWNLWEYAGATASGKVRLWKHYYVVYNHPTWMTQYSHTDNIYCP